MNFSLFVEGVFRVGLVSVDPNKDSVLTSMLQSSENIKIDIIENYLLAEILLGLPHPAVVQGGEEFILVIFNEMSCRRSLPGHEGASEGDDPGAERVLILVVLGPFRTPRAEVPIVARGECAILKEQPAHLLEAFGGLDTAEACQNGVIVAPFGVAVEAD